MKTIQLNKQLILEAVHSNHPGLDKRNPDNVTNRNKLASNIKRTRTLRDGYRKTENNANKSLRNERDYFVQAAERNGKAIDHRRNDTFAAKLNGNIMTQSGSKFSPDPHNTHTKEVHNKLANEFDNHARSTSQSGSIGGNDSIEQKKLGDKKYWKTIDKLPRFTSSAKI